MEFQHYRSAERPAIRMHLMMHAPQCGRSRADPLAARRVLCRSPLKVLVVPGGLRLPALA